MSLFYKIALSLVAIAIILLLSYFLIVPHIALLILAVLSIISIKIIYFIGVFHPSNQLFIPVLTGKDLLDSNEVTFRFDDGPDENFTPQILDILKKHRIKAFFAITGEHSERNPKLVKRIFNEGHVLVNHSFSHDYFISLKNKTYLLKDTQKCNEIIKEITGQNTLYYSPPIGHRNLAMASVLKILNMSLLGWDIQTIDTKSGSEFIIKKVKKELKEKSIILLHDGVYKWTLPERSATLEALPTIIDYIQNESNLKFAKC